MSNDTERDFGDVQDIVEPLAATIIELNRKLQRLKADNLALETELAKVFDALGISNLPDAKPFPTHEHVARLKAENARLAASINETASVYGFTRPPECLRVLRDLLAPTIELLEQHTFDEHGQPYQSPNESRIESELARLRAVCGEKQK